MRPAFKLQTSALLFLLASKDMQFVSESLIVQNHECVCVCTHVTDWPPVQGEPYTISLFCLEQALIHRWEHREWMCNFLQEILRDFLLGSHSTEAEKPERFQCLDWPAFQSTEEHRKETQLRFLEMNQRLWNLFHYCFTEDMTLPPLGSLCVPSRN